MWTMRTTTVLTVWRYSDAIWTRTIRRRPRTRREETDRQGKGAAPHAVPAPQGLQVLCGQDRRYQLQGRQAARPVRSRARQDSAAADFGHVRDAPAQAANRN